MKFRCFLIHSQKLKDLKYVRHIKQLARIAKQQGNLELSGRFRELANIYKLLKRL